MHKSFFETAWELLSRVLPEKTENPSPCSFLPSPLLFFGKSHKFKSLAVLGEKEIIRANFEPNKLIKEDKKEN
ncbi:MAG: hypothetical protein F6K10_06950 [Moorea sp. SIO2B7]|nr:hypothetical protein [Moorena sp. SIO2B7]